MYYICLKYICSCCSRCRKRVALLHIPCRVWSKRTPPGPAHNQNWIFCTIFPFCVFYKFQNRRLGAPLPTPDGSTFREDPSDLLDTQGSFILCPVGVPRGNGVGDTGGIKHNHSIEAKVMLHEWDTHGHQSQACQVPWLLRWFRKGGADLRATSLPVVPYKLGTNPNRAGIGGRKRRVRPTAGPLLSVSKNLTWVGEKL